MKKLSLFALLLLGGCYATAQPMFLPDGSSGYRINCGNYIGEMADCIQKAGDMCGAGGYQMYDQSGHAKSVEAQNQVVIAALNSTPAKHGRSSDAQQSIFIKCKAPPPVIIEAPVPVESKPILPEPTPPTAKPAPPQAKPPISETKSPPADSKPLLLNNGAPIPLQPQ